MNNTTLKNDAWQQVAGKKIQTENGAPLTAYMKAADPVRALGLLEQQQRVSAASPEWSVPVPEAK